MKSVAGTFVAATRVNRRLVFATAVVVAAQSVLSLVASQGVAKRPSAPTVSHSRLPERQSTRGMRLPRPRARARSTGRLVRGRRIGSRASSGSTSGHVFTAKQYQLFVSGKGIGGKQADARLVDESIRILTNTTGTPLFVKINGKLTPIVLGSYGLMVNRAGKLESPGEQERANEEGEQRHPPGGYIAKWCRHNGARASLRMLYRSAYSSEVVYGNKAQQQSGAAQLAPNQKGARSSIVGMSMAPSLWIVNFALIYTLNPSLAAKMPAWWTPIPAKVALAIAESPTGQVPYSEYESSFPS